MQEVDRAFPEISRGISERRRGLDCSDVPPPDPSCIATWIPF